MSFSLTHSLLGGRGLTESWRRETGGWEWGPELSRGRLLVTTISGTKNHQRWGVKLCTVRGNGGHCTGVQCITHSTGCNGGDLCSDPGQHWEKCAHWRSDNNLDNYSPRVNLPSHRFSLFECLQNHKNKIFLKIIIISPASVKRCQELIQYILLEISTFNIPSWTFNIFNFERSTNNSIYLFPPLSS